MKSRFFSGEFPALCANSTGGTVIETNSDQTKIMPNIPQQMQAMAINQLGGPETIESQTLLVPDVGAREVLIRVEVAGVGTWDAMQREGKMPQEKPNFPMILGAECAGTIVAVGVEAKRFQVGERVYAFMNDMSGGYAQYAAAAEAVTATLPDNFDMTMAGGLPVDGATALRGLETLGTGDETRLMIWGASGGVGHAALQLAKRLGARVFAIASGQDGVELCEQLGADEAVDGHDDDIIERALQFAPDGFDSALLTTNNDKAQNMLSLVRKGGNIAFPHGVMPEPTAPDGVHLKPFDANPDAQLLMQLNRLASIDNFKIHIAQTFPLAEAAQAHKALEDHYVGKIVLQVSSD